MDLNTLQDNKTNLRYDFLNNISKDSKSSQLSMEVLPDSPKKDSLVQPSKREANIELAQDTIYRFLLKLVKNSSAEKVILEFKNLFFYYSSDASNSRVLLALADIIFLNKEEYFSNTLKRCCYILVNNWNSSRQYKYIRELIELFTDFKVSRKTLSPTLSRLRLWIANFLESKDYQELKLFAAKFEETEKSHWSTRYTSYLLVPQFTNPNNPIEQREAARALSQQLKERFKFDLAMYTARSQSAVSRDKRLKNPTNLGDEVLRLIKMILVKKGLFNYANVANIFLKQTTNLSYKAFKRSLRKYLIFSLNNQEATENINKILKEKFVDLYREHNESIIDDALLLRTSNRVIEYLTTETNGEPSGLFISLMSQENPLILVVVMLKLILVCRNSRMHLENSIAKLIEYYIQYPEDECRWLINFMDIFNITFTIYAENIEYNLISMNPDKIKDNHYPLPQDIDEYRIFSQQKWVAGLENEHGKGSDEDK